MMAVTKRAIRSAPPPVPAGMTNSTGFVGCQAPSAGRGTPAATNVAPRRRRGLPTQLRCLMVILRCFVLPGRERAASPTNVALEAQAALSGQVRGKLPTGRRPDQTERQ